jgi:hypothetical protein
MWNASGIAVPTSGPPAAGTAASGLAYAQALAQAAENVHRPHVPAVLTVADRQVSRKLKAVKRLRLHWANCAVKGPANCAAAAAAARTSEATQRAWQQCLCIFRLLILSIAPCRCMLKTWRLLQQGEWHRAHPPMPGCVSAALQSALRLLVEAGYQPYSRRMQGSALQQRAGTS